MKIPLSAAKSPQARAEFVWTPRREGLAIAACLLLYFALRLWNLGRDVLNDKFDEGVYLSLMQGATAGQGALYRDYLLCHPPGVMWAGAWLWPRVGGDLTALREIYILFCSLALPPIYLLARKVGGAKAALLTLFLLAASPGFANWLGREIFLDPVLNVPLFAALWLLLGLTQKKTGAAFGAGLLVGAGFLIKETALPAALAILLALWHSERSGAGGEKPQAAPFARFRWLWFGAGFALAWGAVMIGLSQIPNYLHYTFALNAGEPRNWPIRLHELETGFYALPIPLTFGTLGVFAMARNRRDPNERFLGAYALATAALMIVIPKNFYWRYLMGAWPVFCLGAALWHRNYRAKPPAMGKRRVVAVFAALAALVNLATLALYPTHEARTPPEYREALEILRRSPGPLLTSDPLWAAASGHPLTPPTQRLIIATNHLPVPSVDCAAALAECPTVLLNKEALRWLPPETLAAIRRDYRTVFLYGKPGDHWYAEILRRE